MCCSEFPATLRSRGHILAGSGKNLVPLMAGTFFRRRPPCRRFLFQRAAASTAAQINKPFGAKQ